MSALCKYQFIAIEGNIGAGKTTLANLLAKHFNAQLLLEQFADNPFLPSFYENPKQFAFPLELFFMTERYKQQKAWAQANKLFHAITIADYSFSKSLLFAKINLPEEEFKLYQSIFDIIHPSLTHPDVLIYLHAPTDKLQENIKKRNRLYEQSIPNTYLENIQAGYAAHLKKNTIKTLQIDVSNAHFEDNPLHIKAVVHALTDGDNNNEGIIRLP